jgi:hypothetical protein
MTSSRHAVRVQEALYWYWICERVFCQGHSATQCLASYFIEYYAAVDCQTPDLRPRDFGPGPTVMSGIGR